MLNWLFKARRIQGDIQAVQAGPGAVIRRGLRRAGYRMVNSLIR